MYFSHILLPATAFSAVMAMPPLPLPADKRSTAAPVLPSSSLPAPVGTLKYVGLGVGTQNYSCASSDAGTIPTSVGAVANLYSVETFLELFPETIQYLPAFALRAQGLASLANVNIATALKLPLLGKHFFGAPGQPDFDLSAVGAYFAGKKAAAAPAPANAFSGLQNEGAVPWLYLQDAGLGTSIGISSVYRVETAGGSAPANCANSPSQFQVPYAAEYWFYD